MLFGYLIFIVYYYFDYLLVGFLCVAVDLMVTRVFVGVDLMLWILWAVLVRCNCNG